MARPTDDELEDQRALAHDNDGRWSGMTYEQGVANTIAWIVGDAEPPMEEN